MKYKLIKVIAEYLEDETSIVNPGDNRIVVDFGSKNMAHFTHAGFCQEIATEIAEKVLAVVEQKTTTK
jgi:uncharacterized protein (DUF2164 family)